MTSSECSTDCWFSRKSKDWVLTILQEWSPHPSVLALSSRGWLCLHLHYLMALRTRRDRSEVRSVSASAWSMKYLQPAGWPVNWVRFSQQGHSSQLKVMEWQSKSCLQRALGSGCTLHGAVCVSNSSLAWLRYQDTCRTYWQWTLAVGREAQTPQPCTAPDSVLLLALHVHLLLTGKHRRKTPFCKSVNSTVPWKN